MNAVTPHRGGTPVGYVSELSPVEQAAVLYLRLWCEGPDARLKVWDDFAAALGLAAGRRALGTFDKLCALCVQHGRRPMMRHDVACKCIGADEACFANFIACASEGAREDALLIATMIVRPDMAILLVGMAQEFGLSLRRVTGRMVDTTATIH